MLTRSHAEREAQFHKETVAMVSQHIQKLQQEYTDKCVVVDVQRPELCRFKGLNGTVKTINMNGLALVEFDGLIGVGRYDIDIDYLKVIDSPRPKQPAKPTPKK